MLRLRRKSVEKRNSRGDIVRKEEVVTLTKKLHASNKAQERKPEWPPSKGIYYNHYLFLLIINFNPLLLIILHVCMFKHYHYILFVLSEKESETLFKIS